MKKGYQKFVNHLPHHHLKPDYIPAINKLECIQTVSAIKAYITIYFKPNRHYENTLQVPKY